ncbi:Response regulator receiver domain-containing protein [Algoriphagus alkaliphilus]|uniref:Response regulator receiver domain-containing protein n=1 Tax=Algoriphagus alkaliphilus TaxID=279824 RepID=A0A1G5V7P0_9BACT|nr:response regulator [Algoriphagus alkaliphilus]MBA4300901.1 response regulator [Cyclobacterium sp.]SDA41903.1 Response regulator receiver domain-containing protein [Algoriphagus alkaliphilus]
MSSFKIKEVYLVDDDAIVRMVASKILRNIDFDRTISIFENGQKAMDEICEKVSNNEFEDTGEQILLLLDINMPVMDAWEFLDEFTKLDPKIKKLFLISIITSSIDSNDRIKAFSYPEVLDYITKPLSGKHIIDFLKKHKLYED